MLFGVYWSIDLFHKHLLFHDLKITSLFINNYCISLLDQQWFNSNAGTHLGRRNKEYEGLYQPELIS